MVVCRGLGIVFVGALWCCVMVPLCRHGVVLCWSFLVVLVSCFHFRSRLLCPRLLSSPRHCCHVVLPVFLCCRHFVLPLCPFHRDVLCVKK
jgi:hypothetical protein